MKALLAVVMLLLAGAILWGVSGQRSTLRARAQLQSDSVAAETRRVETLQTARRTWEAEQHRAVDSTDSVRAADRKALASMRASNSRLAADLAVALAADTTLPDSTFEQVTHVVGQLSQENERCAAAVITCDSAVAVRDRLLRAADSTHIEDANLLHAQRALTETYRDLANPSWLNRIRGAAPWVVGALLTGVVVGLVAQ